VFVADGAANTKGDRQNPSTIVEKFKENLELKISMLDYSIDPVKSNSDCKLGATQNIQARFLNGITEKNDICNFKTDGTGKFTENPNGTFLQIEQSLKVREDERLRKLFGDAIRNTFNYPEYYRTD